MVSSSISSASMAPSTSVTVELLATLTAASVKLPSVKRKALLAPLVVNGMVFAVSSGQRSAPSRLYVLDTASGKPLWNSALTITSTARARIAAGSGQVYLVTQDNHLYAFGIPMEH